MMIAVVAARRHLPRPLFGYVASVAEEGETARAGREAFNEVHWLPRALVNHRWYCEQFPDYPAERKAVVPFLL